MKSVLLITDVPFWLRRKGNHQRIAALTDYLADHFQVTLLFLGIEKPRLSDERIGIMHACRHRPLPALAWKLFRSLPERLQQMTIRLVDRLHLQRPLDSFSNDRLANEVSSICSAGKFDAVIIEYVWHGYLARAVDRKQSLLILDTHDIYHRRMVEYARFGRRPDKTVTRKQELAIYAQFDRLIAIQKVEFDYLEKLFPGRVILAMHPVMAHPANHDERIKNRSPADKLNLIYFASYGDANIDAIEWFVDEVWNTGLAARFELQIHGAICDSLHISRAGVRVCGKSATVDAVYNTADVAINPQRFGSGLKIKTVEAMGYGVPVLTTTVGAEGLEEVRDLALLCADDRNDMRRQLFRLADDIELQKSLSASGLEYVTSRLTPEACFGSLHRLIEAQHPKNSCGERV